MIFPMIAAEEVQVKSWDGTLMPLSIGHRIGMKLDGNNPPILGDFGGYGISIPSIYPHPRHSLLIDRITGGLWSIRK